AAPVFHAPGGAISNPPDNAFNDSTLFVIPGTTPIFGPQGSTPLFTFGTHQHTAPAGTQSVTSFLNSTSTGLQTPPGGSRVAALLDFLRAVSSQTSLTPALTVSNFTAQATCTPAHT